MEWGFIHQQENGQGDDCERDKMHGYFRHTEMRKWRQNHFPRERVWVGKFEFISVGDVNFLRNGPRIGFVAPWFVAENERDVNRDKCERKNDCNKKSVIFELLNESFYFLHTTLI